MQSRAALWRLLLVGAASLWPSVLPAQQGGEVRPAALRVFLDCSGEACDFRYIRTEITFVNWVRDRRDAQVHVIVTSQRTGGGREYRLDFIGLEGLAGRDDRLTVATSSTDTDDERLRALVGVLEVGLARYALLAGAGGGPFSVAPLRAEPVVEDLPPGLQGEVEDPWDFWIFRVDVNGSLSGEERQSSQSVSGSFRANRTTETWKVDLGVEGSYRRREVELNDSTTFTDDRRDWEVGGEVAYSLADRWSLGLETGAEASTRFNQDVTGRIGGGIEYSFFPYEEATRRRLTVRWMLFARYYNYEEETVFDKMEETVGEASMRWGLGFRQPWGNAGFYAVAEAFLHDPAKNRLSLGGGFTVRLVRGLNWRVNGRVSRIRDQIYLPKGGITDEEILVQRRQLPTDFDFRISMGLSYSFGSIYNNVVNNRFF